MFGKKREPQEVETTAFWRGARDRWDAAAALDAPFAAQATCPRCGHDRVSMDFDKPLFPDRRERSQYTSLMISNALGGGFAHTPTLPSETFIAERERVRTCCQRCKRTWFTQPPLDEIARSLAPHSRTPEPVPPPGGEASRGTEGE